MKTFLFIDSLILINFTSSLIGGYKMQRNTMEISALVAEDENKKEKSCFRKYLELIKNFIIKNFLPISLIVAVVFGVLVPQPGVALNHKATLYVCVVGIFLYSGLYLRTDALKEVVKSYKAALWGILSILAFTSIIGGKLTMLLDFNEEYVSKFNQSMKNSSSNSSLQNNLSSRISLNQNFTGTKYKHGLGPAEFKVGLLVFFCMPCTISSGVVMVTQLGGNFVLALILTVVANIAGVFTIPLFFKWFLTTVTDVNLDVLPLLLQLCLTLLLPLIIGKCLRFIKRIKDFVVVPRHKLVLKLISVTLLAVITWLKVSKSSQDGKLDQLTITSAFFIIAWALTMHTLFLILNTVASYMLKLTTDERKCIIILASQKTLAVAIPTITFLPASLGDQGLMAIAMVLCHLTMILFDAVLIPIWLRCEKQSKPNDVT